MIRRERMHLNSSMLTNWHPLSVAVLFLSAALHPSAAQVRALFSDPRQAIERRNTWLTFTTGMMRTDYIPGNIMRAQDQRGSLRRRTREDVRLAQRSKRCAQLPHRHPPFKASVRSGQQSAASGLTTVLSRRARLRFLLGLSHSSRMPEPRVIPPRHRRFC